MGCRVPGDFMPENDVCEHLRMGVDTGDLQFFTLSVVSAPKCDECGTTMKPASSTEWACPNEECKLHGEAIHVGIYPILETREVK